MHSDRHFLIIGAGVAGSAAASTLTQLGILNTLIDKARGVGGRMATKRMESLRVDTGAQFFTVTDPRLQNWVDARLPAGDLFEWSTGFSPLKAKRPHYACRSGMSSIAKWLAEGSKLHLGQPATAIARTSAGFGVTLQDGTVLSGTDLIFNLPPRQLVPLARDVLDPQTLQKVEATEFDSCFAVYAALARDLEVDWMGLELEDHPIFSWVARDHTRRAPGSPPALLAHTRPDWTRLHLEDDPTRVAALAEQALRDLLSPALAAPLQVHRWRYSRPTQICELPLWDPARRVGICGDWTRAGRVEGALTSGWDVASLALNL